MATTINQQTVLNSLHNLMGHRVAPGGTDEDLKRYVQESFDYAWRYYRWKWSLKTVTTAVDGILPVDFDLDGYYDVADTYNVTWDQTTGRLLLDPIGAVTLTYQITPPTLDPETNVPFPSAQVIAEGAVIYAKLGENPTRADVSQEWDMFHANLDRLVGRADRNTPRRPVHYLDVAGTFVGDVGA